MSIGAISTLATSLPSSATNAAPISVNDYFKVRAEDMAELRKDVAAGDLTRAEQDYQAVVDLGKKMIQRDNPFFRADRAKDFDAVGGALQNGDLAGAQQYLKALADTFIPHMPPGSGTSGGSGSTTTSDGISVSA